MPWQLMIFLDILETKNNNLQSNCLISKFIAESYLIYWTKETKFYPEKIKIKAFKLLDFKSRKYSLLNKFSNLLIKEIN